MRKRIIFLDFDGTLTTADRTVPDSAIQAIRQSRHVGHKVFLCTGRSIIEIFDWILEIGFDGIIASGGGYIEIQKEMIYHKQFKRKELHEIMEYLDNNHIDFILEGNHALYASENCKEHIQNIMEDAYFEDILVFDADLSKVQEINKIAFLDSSTSIDEIRKKFETTYQVVQCTVPAFGKESGEIALMNIHKASAIQRVLAYLQMKQEDSFAYGDGLNDMEMIAYVKHGIAMKDGHPDVLKIADDIADSAKEDGIKKSFMKYGLL